MMRAIEGDWLHHPGTLAVMSALITGGGEALFVGGCVRNALLGHPVGDIDIATAHPPEEVLRRAEAAGIRAVPTGIAHGTVTLVSHDRPHEVTTFRRDVETDGRRAVVAFSERVEEDAARRDFTMNALYATLCGEIVDPLGCLPDLEARRVRFVGDPWQRIVEDYLRILRFFRFFAWYGDVSGGVDAEGLAACAELADGIEGLSAERVGAETLKLLSAPDPAPAVASMAMSGILSRILPGADAAPLSVLVHLEGVIGIAPDPLRRLASLGGDAGALRLSRRDARRRETLRRGIGSEAGAAENAWRLGPEIARDIELLRAAIFGAPLPATLEAEVEKGARARFPLTGSDFEDRLQGAQIGAALRDCERRWIDSGFTLGREDLLA